MNLSSWSKWVTCHRERCGWSKRYLAKRIKMNPSYVTLWERDGRVPRRNVVISLAFAFGLDLKSSLSEAGYLFIPSHDMSIYKNLRRPDHV